MAGFEEVKVNRSLDFVGAANEEANIGGYPLWKKVFFGTHFVGAVTDNAWTSATQGATVAHGTNAHTVTITTDATDDGCGEVYHTTRQWRASKNCIMEARIQMSAITGIGVNVGWADAVHNTNDQINFELNSSNALVNGRATDGAVLIFDTDADTDVWYCAAVDSDTEGTPVATLGSLAPVAATYANLRVALKSDGDAYFYYNGTPVGYRPVAVSFAATDYYIPYVAVIARGAAERILTVCRIHCWEDE